MSTKTATDYKIQKILERLKKSMVRPVVGSLVACVHCGMCVDSCHYVLSMPDDPKMAPPYKADQIRKIFKRHIDWTGRLLPWWVGAKDPKTDEDLQNLKDIVFGTCTGCRRCTLNCPMGVDTATLVRLGRGLLTSIGIMPEGVEVVSRDQWELGNQMGVLKEDYIETLEWLSDEIEDEIGDSASRIPIDKAGCNVVYSINPREIKYDPRTITAAAKIFYYAGENWTMPSEAWDMTNFGLFSGDNALGGAVGKRLFEKVEELEGQKLVISECGHGYRATRCEAQTWGGKDIRFPMESSVITMLQYIKEGRIKVDKTRNTERVTYHDSCNLARSCGFTEEPRELLNMVVTDFQEMYPNRAENFCCTGGGGAMSMSEYSSIRLKSAKHKAKQLAETGAKIVVTSCHNCVDGLNDLIKHYKLGMKVKQLVELVEEALVIPPKPEPEEKAPEATVPAAAYPGLEGKKVLVVDDEPDILEFLTTVMGDHGMTTVTASDGEEALKKAKEERPDLITLDLSMPGKDGVETFCELRQDKELADIPVCIITGQPQFRKVIYDRPVKPPEGYIEKPVSEEDLIFNIRKIFEVGVHK